MDINMKIVFTLMLCFLLNNSLNAGWEQIHPVLSQDNKDTTYYFKDHLRLFAQDSKGNIFVGGKHLHKYDILNNKWDSIPTEYEFDRATDMDIFQDTLWVSYNHYFLGSTLDYTYDEGKTWISNVHQLNLFDIDVFENGEIVASGIQEWDKYGNAMTYVIFFFNYGADYTLSVLHGYDWHGFHVNSDFLDLEVGYYSGEYECGITNNKGKSWKRTMIEIVNEGEGVQFLDSLNFVASISKDFGRKFEFVKSTDGGDSYSVMDTNKYLALLHFEDPLVGLACRNYKYEPDTLFKTLDGGKTWISLDTVLPVWNIYAMYTEVPGEIWVIGDDSKIFKYISPLEATKLSFPEDSVYFDQTSITFNWVADINAVKYQVELSYEKDMSYPFKSIITEDTEITMDSILENKIIYWHVRTFSDTDVSNWSETRMVSTLDISGISDKVEFLSIAPNPCSDILEIDFLSYSEKTAVSFEVYDSYGNYCFSQTLGMTSFERNKVPINVENLSSGVYFLKLLIGTENNIIKFVKVE